MENHIYLIFKYLIGMTCIHLNKSNIQIQFLKWKKINIYSFTQKIYYFQIFFSEIRIADVDQILTLGCPRS